MDVRSKECELVGAIIGDGYIYTKNCKYVVGFTGHPKTDKEYFDYLHQLIFDVWGKKAALMIRCKGVRIRFNSKPTVTKLLQYFKLPSGEGKCERVELPAVIASDWNLAKHAIRSIVDTDGSIFVADKPGSPNYPSIEITTVSKKLAVQLRQILLAQGFRVANIWKYNSNNSKRTAFKVPLNGKENLQKWVQEIGFSNPYKLRRALDALQ